MARLLIWLVVAGLVWWLWRTRERPPATQSPPPQSSPEAVSMVRCHHCGVHLPAGDALRDGANQPYCCGDHRQLGPPPP